MTKTRQIISLEACLNGVPSEHADRLRMYLPNDEQVELQSATPLTRHPLKDSIDLEEILSNIHPLWWTPALEGLSNEDTAIFISALKSPLKEAIAEMRSLPIHELPSKLLKDFLHDKLLLRLSGDEVLPLPLHCFDDHPLYHLATLGYTKLDELIHTLGLFDLSKQIDQIIQSKHLKSIESMLNPKQIQFVRSLKKQRDIPTIGELGLTNWDGNLDTLKEVLFKRGLNRLAKAICDMPKSLLWYLERHMHPEAAQDFKKLVFAPKDPSIKELLMNEVQEALNFLQENDS